MELADRDTVLGQADFVTTARAAPVDEAALLADAQLRQLPNVVAVPHLGGATAEATPHQSRITYEALTGLLRGAPLDVVNRQALPQALRRLGLKAD